MIPLSVPNINGNEWKYVKDCMDTGWISSAGEYVNKFEESIQNYSLVKHAIACMNGTVGIQTCLNLLNVKENDIVITTNLTFVATLNAISYTKATPLLFDINKSTWQIDLELVDNWLAENTYTDDSSLNPVCRLNDTKQKVAAIVPVHVLGALVDIPKLTSISENFHIPIVEDSTEALGSTYKGKSAGTFGKFGVFSFNGNKIISTGGGGMIVTNYEMLAKKAKHITTTAKTDPLDYFHDEIGYNYRLVNVLAAIGVAQMENFSNILKRKKKIDHIYREELSTISEIRFQDHIEDSDPNCWLFTFRTPRMRNLLDYLNNNGIQSRPFWTPMNSLPMYSNLKYINNSDVTGKIFSECISIPSSSNLTEIQQEEVINKIKRFYHS
jgi:aminotransferase in exopolysaccharide biosynthesis